MITPFKLFEVAWVAACMGGMDYYPAFTDDEFDSWQKQFVNGHDYFDVWDCVRFDAGDAPPEANVYAILYRDKANCWHTTFPVKNPVELEDRVKQMADTEEWFRFGWSKQ